MSNCFSDKILSTDHNRSSQLVQEYYELHHENRDIESAKDMDKKAVFYKEKLAELGYDQSSEGVDIGCRAGVLIKMVEQINWCGIDIDRNALDSAQKKGISTQEMDVSIGMNLKDNSFDVIMMTEILEHLPFPALSVREVHRIVNSTGCFLGSVPLDYHLHRRWSVMRGRRLEADPTHIHHFSFTELDNLLRHYFNKVEYVPIRGTAARHPNWNLSYKHFVRDIAFAAWDPKPNPSQWKIEIVL